MGGVGNDFQPRALADLPLDKLRVRERSVFVVGARYHQRRLLDLTQVGTQVDLMSRQYVGIAHARIGLDLLHPGLADEAEVVGDGLG